MRAFASWSHLWPLQRPLPFYRLFILAMFTCFDGILARSKFLKNMFMLAFIHSIHLSVGGPSCMVFEHLQNLFDLKNLANNFS